LSTSRKQRCECRDSTALAELRIGIGRVIADYQHAGLSALEQDEQHAAWYFRVAEHLKSEIRRSSETETQSHDEKEREQPA
jgi:hypothetical protein